MSAGKRGPASSPERFVPDDRVRFKDVCEVANAEKLVEERSSMIDE